MSFRGTLKMCNLNDGGVRTKRASRSLTVQVKRII